MELYFGCWILGKLDDDGDIFMNLGIFCACEIESVSDQGEGAKYFFTSCTTLAEHVIWFETNVFMLSSIPSPVSYV